MTTITVRERDRLPIGGVSGLDPRSADRLARLLPRLPKGAVLQEHQAFRFGPFCGVLRVGSTVIEVLPKVAVNDDAAARGTVMAMLRAVGDLSLATTQQVGLGMQALHLLDLFILDFCNGVQARLQRGALRQYEVQQDNIATVRGRIQFAENARRNPFDRSRLVCRYDELLLDNVYNRALKFVLHRLLGHCLHPETKRVVNGVLRCMEEVADQPCTAADIECLRFNRLTSVWQPVFRRAAWLLRGLYPDLFAGQLEAVGLLFSMQQLFERFVGVVLRRTWSGSNAQVVLQGPPRNFAQTAEGEAFGMRPDATVVAPDGLPALIVDAKWKQLDKADRNSGVSRDDIYQMAAYAACYECRELALAYPCDPASTPGFVERFLLPRTLQAQVSVYALDVAALTRGQALPIAFCPPSSVAEELPREAGPPMKVGQTVDVGHSRSCIASA